MVTIRTLLVAFGAAEAAVAITFVYFWLPRLRFYPSDSTMALIALAKALGVSLGVMLLLFLLACVALGLWRWGRAR